MTIRTFNIFGTASADAKIELWIDDQYQGLKEIDHNNCDSFDSSNSLIYQFTTDVSAHGFTKIKLKVLAGQVQIGRTKVCYPAQTTDLLPIHGYICMYQPFDPKFLVRINNQVVIVDKQDENLTGEWIYNLIANDVFEYAHLYVNGPTFWFVDNNQIDIQQFKSIGIFIPYMELRPGVFKADYNMQSLDINLIKIIAESNIRYT
jgi:hypothetical protein